MASDAERQSKRRERAERALLCRNGRAHIDVDGVRTPVLCFLPPIDDEGYPTLGQYGPPDAPITFEVAKASFVGARPGLAAHGPRGRHKRCKYCRDVELAAQRDSWEAKGKKKRHQRARRARQRSFKFPRVSKPKAGAWAA